MKQLRNGWGLGLVALCMVGANAVTACSSESNTDEPVDTSSSSSGGNGGNGSSSSGGASSSGNASSSSSSGGGGTSSSSSGGGSSSSSGSSSGEPVNLTADITEQSMEKDDGHCTYDTTEPIVDAHSAGANAAIAEVLPLFDPVTRCMGAGPYPRTYHFSSRYSVRANAWGLLALLQRGYDAIGNDNDFFYRGRNFDLATGASLKLSAVLDPAGIAKVRSGCIGTAILPGKPYDSDIAGATEVCDEALAVPEPSFQIEPEGLRLYMDYPYYSMLDGEASELGALIEWSTLEDNITSPVVRTYVNQVTN